MRTFSAPLFGILGIICGSYGLERRCDITREDRCYGPLGGSLVIKLMEDNLDFLKWDLKKNGNRIYIWGPYGANPFFNESKTKYFHSKGNRSLTITSLNKGDENKYQLGIFNKDGKQTNNKTFSIHLEAPVSSFNLTWECLPDGSKNVSCNVKEENVSYKWTLDGKNVTGVQLRSGSSGAKSIVLNVGVLGRLECLVRNNVSSMTAEVDIPLCGVTPDNSSQSNDTCTGVTPGQKNNRSEGLNSENQVTPSKGIKEYWPVLLGVLLVLVLLLSGLGVVYVCRKRRKEDTQELTYADVNIVDRGGKRRPREEEEMVAYSEVRIQRTARPVQEFPVYATVQRVQ